MKVFILFSLVFISLNINAAPTIGVTGQKENGNFLIMITGNSRNQKIKVQLNCPIYSYPTDKCDKDFEKNINMNGKDFDISSFTDTEHLDTRISFRENLKGHAHFFIPQIWIRSDKGDLNEILSIKKEIFSCLQGIKFGLHSEFRVNKFGVYCK